MLKAFKEEGTAPVKLLLERVSSDNFVRLPNSLGMFPVSEFTASQRYFKFDKLPSSAGILPLSELLLSVSQVKLVRFPSSLGILPLSELFSRPSTTKLVKPPNSLGILPLSELKSSSRSKLSMTEELKELKALYKEGSITKSEFEKAKKKLLKD